MKNNEIKDVSNVLKYKDKEYKIVFNLNVMQELQEEYGTLEKWGELTDGSTGEPNAKAVIYGFMVMINEGIDIENEENGTDIKPLTLKQVGRMISDIGLENTTAQLNNAVIESTKGDDDGKNV